MQETRVVSFIQNHVVSDHCEATSRNRKFHATLLIICVTNVTKYCFLHSLSVQFYAKTQAYLSFFISRYCKINRIKPIQKK